MSKIQKQTSALALLTSSSVTAKINRDQLVLVSKEQLHELLTARQQAPYRAILLGLTLHKIKATCAHGEWMPVYEDILSRVKICTPSSARVLCSYYMRLSLAFLVATDAATPEFIALPGSQAELTLESKDATARRFMEKMSEFVDARSLEELLNDEGIKGGQKKKLSKAKAPADASEAETRHELTVQDRFNEIDGLLRRAADAAEDKAVWMSFTKQQHADLKARAEQTAEAITALWVKTHGRNAK